MPTSPSSIGLAGLDSALQKILVITAKLRSCTDLRHPVLKELIEKDVSALLHHFATQNDPTFGHWQGAESTNSCSSTYVETVARLHERLRVLMVTIGLHSLPGDADVEKFLDSLVEKQVRLPHRLSPCIECASLKKRPMKSSLSLFEACSTPRTQSVSHNWKETLFQEMSMNMHHQQEAVAKVFGEICRDLELRCVEAERPFREEVSRSCDLQTELEDSQARTTELEALVRSQSCELDELRKDKHRHSKETDAFEERLQDLSEQLSQMRQNFNQAKGDNERAAKGALERSRQQDLDYMAVIAGKDLLLEEQATKLALSENYVKDLEDEAILHKSITIKNTEIITSNEICIQELNANISLTKEMATSRSIEVDRIKLSGAQLIASKEQIAKEAQEEAVQHQALIWDLRIHLEAEMEKFSDLQQEFKQYANTKDAEMQSLENLHKSSHDRLQAEMENVRNIAEKDCKKGTIQIDELRDKLNDLSKEREQQAEAVAEARAMKRGFMAFMGNINKQRAPATSNSWLLDDSHSSQYTHPSRSTDCTEQRVSDLGATNSNSSFGSNTSSKSGPTLKRMRADRASSSQITRACKSTKSKTKSKHIPRGVTRTPLVDLSLMPNSELSNLKQRTRWQKSRRNNEKVIQDNEETWDQYLDNETFGVEDVFSSSCQRQASALHRMQSEASLNTFDESRAEF